MSRRTAAYWMLVRRTGLDPAVVHEIDISSKGGSKVGAVRAGERLHVPGHGAVHFIGYESDRAVMTLPRGLEHTGTRSAPRSDPELPAAPACAAEYWERVAMIATQVAVFSGRVHLAGGRENGWLPIVERVVDTIVAVLGPRDVVTVMFQLTFGMLGAWIRTDCEDLDIARFVGDLGPWAEAVAMGRCMVSGEPGRQGPILNGDQWDYTLSDRVRELSDPLAPELIYPRPPQVRP